MPRTEIPQHSKHDILHNLDADIRPPVRPTVYLAGPGVFLTTAREHGKALIALAEINDLVGLYPLPTEDIPEPNLRLQPGLTAASIRQANIRMIEQCDGVLADLTPFRGVSADPGTTYEIGYAQALRKPVIGYVSSRDMLSEYKSRIGHTLSHVGEADASGKRQTILIAEDGMTVEDFGLSDNLMFTSALQGLFTNVESAMEAMADLLLSR